MNPAPSLKLLLGGGRSEHDAPPNRAVLVAAWGLWGFTLLCLLAAAVTPAPRGAANVTSFGTALTRLLEPFLQMALATLGVMVVSRRPRNAVGWMLLAIALLGGLASVAFAYAVFALVVQHSDLPGGPLAAWVYTWRIIPTLALLLVFIPLLFPDGRPSSRRWRWVLWLAILATTATTAGRALQPGPLDQFSHTANPFGISGGAAGALVGWASGALFLFPLLFVAGIVSLGLRFRASDGRTRQQIKWVLYGVSLAVLVNGIEIPLHVLRVSAPIFEDLVNFSPLMICFAAGIAIMKYRLYDIDVVITRTLVYGLLAAFITSVYVLVVVGLGSILGQGGRPNLTLSVGATAVVAMAFGSMRDRFQKLANRLVFGRRASPYEVLANFTERVGGAYDLDDLLPRMARLLAAGTSAASATVWLRVGPKLVCQAVWPVEADVPAAIRLPQGQLPAVPGSDIFAPVTHGGELLGALAVVKHTGENLTPVEQKLVDDLTLQAGLVLKNAGLTAELAQRIDDLRRSRQRLVTAQDEERRRIERDIHDGAQHRLVSLRIQAAMAESMAEKDPKSARDLMSSVKIGAEEALQELRELARGIYPPLLEDSGLVAALEEQASHQQLTVRIRADNLKRYGADVETAVYFSCLEGLQNVAKYADATAVVIRLSARGGRLRFEVQDDGIGFDMERRSYGTGLHNISDRLEALGGTFAVESVPGKGTVIRGSVPARAIRARSAKASLRIAG